MPMIIDIHTHYGIVPGKFNMPIEMLLAGMKKYSVDYCLISNIACGYWQGETNGNKEMIEIARQNTSKLGVMLWCAPGNGSDFEKFCEQYNHNKDIIKGIKIHPDISGKNVRSLDFVPYIKFASDNSLPILVHTQDNKCSNISSVIKVAQEFKDVKFILGHMSLLSDNGEAINALVKYNNIYADTTWVKLSSVLKADQLNVSNKIMFGTDSPVNGIDTYNDTKYYTDYYHSTETFIDNVMYNNAKKFFKL